MEPTIQISGYYFQHKNYLYFIVEIFSIFRNQRDKSHEPILNLKQCSENSTSFLLGDLAIVI